ncbi:hypothetical protein GAMM_60209 [Gammaproteobacteria bacterium]
MLLQMLNVGEETGMIDRMLIEIAKYYEEEIKHDLDNLSETMEPVVLAFMGVMVLVLALGVFLPIFNMVKFTH